MAGTDRSRPAVLGGPAVILVEPQLGENIGTAARAMYNFGLTDLRLVRPRDGWPSDRARAAASGADVVVDAARLYDSVSDAVADLRHVFATTARSRGMVKTILTPRAAMTDARERERAGIRCGILFGRENTGLVNDEVALAASIVAVPVNPAFASLNLAQAVLLLGYEWFLSDDATPPKALPLGATRPASQDELLGMFEHLEAELRASGFLYPPDKCPTMIRNIRAMFHRAELTEQEIRTLRGMIKALAHGRQRASGA